MKKNLIAAAVASVLVPFAAQAGSHGGMSVKFSGDAEVNYYNHNISNADMWPNGMMPEVKDNQWDSRVRLVVQGTDGKNAMAKARLRMRNGSHDQNRGASAVDFDYAFLQLNIDDLFMLKAGNWKRNWGHKLYVWDEPREGVSLIKKMGDLTFGFHQVMHREDSASLGAAMGAAGTGVTKLEDDDRYQYTLSVVMGKGEQSMGARVDMIKDDTDGVDDMTNFDIYGGVPLGGGWGIGFEYASRDTSPDKQTGLLLAAMGKAGPADLTAFYVMSTDGYATDDDLFSFAFTGAENGAIMTGLGGSNGLTTKDSTGMGLIAGMDVTDDMNVELGVGLVQADRDTSGAMNLAAMNSDDSSVTILSAKLTKSLSDNSSVNFQLGNYSGDYKATAYGMTAETSF